MQAVCFVMVADVSRGTKFIVVHVDKNLLLDHPCRTTCTVCGDSSRFVIDVNRYNLSDLSLVSKKNI